MTPPTPAQLEQLRAFVTARYRQLERDALGAIGPLPGIATAAVPGSPLQQADHQKFLDVARPPVVAAASRAAVNWVETLVGRIETALEGGQNELASLGWTVLLGDAEVFRDHPDWMSAWDDSTSDSHFLGSTR